MSFFYLLLLSELFSNNVRSFILLTIFLVRKYVFCNYDIPVTIVFYFRLYLFILGASTKVLTAIFVLLAYLYYKRPQKKNIETEAVITINRQTSQVAIIPIVSS